MSPFAALAGTATSGINSMFNYWMNQRNNENMIAQWQRENQYNTPENQVQRLLNAGLNPAMIYGNGGIMNEAAASPALNPAQSKLTFDAAALMQDAQIDVLNAQAEDYRASAQQKRQETKGKEIQNELDGMNLASFKEAYEHGLPQAAMRAGFQSQYAEGVMSTQEVYENAWNFAILFGTSLQESLMNGAFSWDGGFGVDSNFYYPSFDKESFDKAKELFHSGQNAEIQSNYAVELASRYSAAREERNISVFQFLDELKNSPNSLDKVLGYIGYIGLYLSENRFSLPTINISPKVRHNKFSRDSHNVHNDYSGHDHKTTVINKK